MSMELLEYGIQNENGGSLLQRTLARGILAIEKKRADLCEINLNKREISFPDGPEENAALFKKIQEQIDTRNMD